MKFAVKPMILALATAFSAAANAADEAKPATLDEVVVNASSLPLGSYSLDSASLKTMKAATSDTGSLLRDVPGVSLYGAGGVSSFAGDTWSGG